MGQLKNMKHEIFVRNLVKTKGDQKAAYLKTFGTKNENTASNASSMLMRRPEVRERAREILDAHGLTIDNLTVYLKENIIENSKDCPVRQDAIKTAYKIQGVLDKAEVNIDIDARSIDLVQADPNASGVLSQITDIMQALNEKMGFIGYKEDKPAELDAD